MLVNREATMRTGRIVALIVMATVIFGAGWLRAQPRGERTTITGEVVDMWCYLEGGDRGAAKKACATACAKAGNPIAILDAKGDLYVTAGLKDHQPAQTLLLDKMSELVTVSGTLVKKGGVTMIYVESVR
jgi:hypothetical protein